MSEGSASATQGQLAAVIGQMTETIMLHIQMAEARIVKRVDAMGARLDVLEAHGAQSRAFRAGFADDDGNLINGKTVIKRIVAIEKTVGTINGLYQMGKGALALGKFQLFVAGFILLILIKGTWEGVEWLLSLLPKISS